MPFNYLLWNCLLPGKTSVSESGVVAALKPVGDETVLAFRIDTDGFREKFGTNLGCDALFFQKTNGEDPTILLVELKASDVEHGIKQLAETLGAVRKSLGREYPAEFKAVVRTEKGVPTIAKKRIKKFKDAHGVVLRISKNKDLRDCLKK